jgi:subtilisin family serine protease
MRRIVIAMAVVGLALAGMVASSGGATAAATKGKYIVVLKDGVTDPGAVAKGQAAKYGGTVGFVYQHALKGYSVTLSDSDVAALRSDPNVADVEPDTPMQAACRTSPPNSQQCVGTWADRVGASSSSTTSGDGAGSVNVNVAVIDSGIDVTHPDLNVVGGTDCTAGKGFDDTFGHGTMVAGIIGAKDNGLGVVGVAPAASLWAVRVLNKNNTASKSQVLCGVDWVTATRTDSDPSNDIAVANMSLGGQGADNGNCGNAPKNDPLHQAICASVASGVTYVVAAGNDSQDVQKVSPAAYDEVLTVTATVDTDGLAGGLGPVSTCVAGNADDTAASFSNFATLPTDQAHTVAAPGNCDETTFLGGGYITGTGTSFAAPQVAGTVALCIASGPCAGLTPAQIIQKIVSDAAAYNTANPSYGFIGDPQHPIAGKYYGNLIRAALY